MQSILQAGWSKLLTEGAWRGPEPDGVDSWDQRDRRGRPPKPRPPDQAKDVIRRAVVNLMAISEDPDADYDEIADASAELVELVGSPKFQGVFFADRNDLGRFIQWSQLDQLGLSAEEIATAEFLPIDLKTLKKYVADAVSQ